MAMNYRQAQALKNRSTFALMRERFAEGQSLTSSFKTARKLKKQARWMRIKEKFDPMMWSRKIFGKWGATFYGRAMGRSADDMQRFTGYRPHTTKRKKVKLSQSSTSPKINPLYTKVGAGTVTPLRKNDSMADVVAKLYNFIKRTHDKDKKNNEISHNFEKEAQDNSDKRHSELIEIIKSTYTKVEKPEKEKKEESGKGIAGWLLSLGSTVLGILGTLGGILATIAAVIIKTLGKFVLTLAVDLVTHLARKVLGVLGEVLWWVAKKIWKIIVPPIADLLGPLVRPLLSAMLPALVGSAVAVYLASLGLDKFIESEGGAETIRAMEEFDKQGIIENNNDLLNPKSSKVLDWDKITPEIAKTLARSDDWSGKDKMRLNSIANPESTKPGQNKLYDIDNGVKGKEAAPQPIKITPEIEATPISDMQTNLIDANFDDTYKPISDYIPLQQNRNDEIQSVTEQSMELNSSFIAKPSGPVVYNNSTSKSIQQSSSTSESLGSFTTRNTDETFRKILGEPWKAKNGT